MEILGELLWVLLRIFLEVFGQVLLELGLEGVKEALGRENRHPALAALGYLILGAGVGGLTAWWWPERLMRAGPIPGISLMVGPLLAGVAMAAWGRFRRSQGHDTTNLATFLGGAAFAFGLSLVRFLLVVR